MSFTCREVPLPFDIPAIIAEIPELRPIPPEKLAKKLIPGSILLVAEAGGRAVAFKLGYPISPQVFYSWIGGVIPAFRGHGTARALMKMQEQLAQERGYGTIRVKSMNQFPAMLHLLISADYKIVDTEYPTSSLKDSKIVFEKRISQTGR